MEKTNLLHLGYDGQVYFLRNILTNTNLFMEVIPYLKKNYFTENSIKKVVEFITDRYKTQHTVTNLQELEYILRNGNTDDLTTFQKLFKKLTQPLTDDEVRGMEEVSKICLEFIKRMEVINIADKLSKHLKDKGYNEEKITDAIEELQKLFGEQVTELQGEDLLDEVLNQPQTEKIPTGIEEIDIQMNGGLRKKSVGLLIAGTGIGKSSLSSIISMQSALKNNKVLYIFFEDDITDIGAKLYANLTNLNINSFFNSKEKSTLKNKIYGSHPNAKNALNNNIKLFRLPNGSTSVEDIASLLYKLKHINNWCPDMIFIDYLSCLKSTNNEVLKMQNECQALERVMKRIESLASEFNCAIWVAQQTNRNGMDADTADKRITNIQGSFRATQPCSAILYLDRAMNKTKDFTKANLFLDKVRGGTPAEWYNITLNNGTCQIDFNSQINTEEDLEWTE